MALTKVRFHNGNALGDILMMTCAIRDFKKAFGDQYECDVDTTCKHVWDNNPNITRFGKDDKPREINLGPKRAVQGSNTSGLHYANGFRLSIEENLKIKIPQGHIKADLYLTDKEKEERIIEGRYWMLVAGGKRDQFTSKVWPYEWWQKVVDLLGHITFVQVGDSRDPHRPLKGDNIINLIGKTEHPDTGLRDLFRMFYHADGSVGLVSMHSHLSAAFDRASVVVAGAREPVSFERYNHHQFLSNQGTLRCNNFCTNCTHFSIKPLPVTGKDGKVKTERKKTCDVYGPEGVPVEYYASKKLCDHYDPIMPNQIKTTSCWRASIGGCPNQVQGHAKCIMLIQPLDVAKAIFSYYEHGALPPIKEKAKQKIELKTYIVSKEKPVFKMVANAHAYMGGERSTAWILNKMIEKGYKVQFCSTKGVCKEFQENISPEVKITSKLTDPCDIFMIYANDMIWEFSKEPYVTLMPQVKANKKIMMLNYKIGAAGKVGWTKKFDLYGFLCTKLRDDFLGLLPDAQCFVLPPPVEIEEYLKEGIDYNQTLHLVRHSSQGDSKHPQDTEEMILKIRDMTPWALFSFMPGPSFLNGLPKVYKYHTNEMKVVDFLKKGSCYWYRLPEGYTDQGPRTIIEAMAIGLPVIADNRWGARDRVTDDTGWLCETANDYATVVHSISSEVLKRKGLAAKERARDHFNPYRWIETITN